MDKVKISHFKTGLLGYLLLCCSCQELCSIFCSGTNCTVAKELLRVNNKFQETFLSEW